MLQSEAMHVLDVPDPPAAGVGMGGSIICRIGATPVAPLAILSTMLPPIGGVSQVRIVEPLRCLASEAGITVQIDPRLGQVPIAGDDPCIAILHRPALLGATGLATIRGLLDRGWLVVCEFDDHPSHIPILHRSDVQNFRAVHAIQTSTLTLAQVFVAENPNVFVFPNAIVELPALANFVAEDHITLLFAALNREEEWPGHIEALNQAAAAAGPRLRFHVIADQAFFDALDTPHKVFTPLCDYATYLAILGRCEVSFMPLRDTLFNRCKSDLKFLEAAAHRVVALASPVVYGETIRDGVDGLLFTDSATLRGHLDWLVANLPAARGIAEAGREHVARRRMAAYQVADRAAWYRDLWARRAELRQALLERVPELAARPG